MGSDTIKFYIKEKESEIYVKDKSIENLHSQIAYRQKKIDELLNHLEREKNDVRQRSLQSDLKYETEKIHSLQLSLNDELKGRKELQEKLNRLNRDYLDSLKRESDAEIEKQKREQRRQEADFDRQKKEWVASEERKQSNKGHTNEPEETERFAPAPIHFRGAIRWIIYVALILFAIALIVVRFIDNEQPQNTSDRTSTEELTTESLNDPVFEAVPEDAIGAVYVKIDELYIRSMPSTDGNTPKRFAEKDGVYYVYDIVQDDEYTWYRIGEDEWIADHDREWAEFFQDLN